MTFHWPSTTCIMDGLESKCNIQKYFDYNVNAIVLTNAWNILYHTVL